MRGCACRGTAGFAHVSCLAEQAKILVAEAEENNLDDDAFNERWTRWHTCSLCEQEYHGVVSCALGWACWKTYVDRPEADDVRRMAMSVLGCGLSDADYDEEALSVKEAELAMVRRLGASEETMLAVQSNLANLYQVLGRYEESLALQREVYSVCLKLFGEHEHTLRAANNYACSLYELQRFEEARVVLRKMMPVARRVLGEGHRLTLKMRSIYATVLCEDPVATLDDVREAVTTLEDTARIARRVFGGAHPITVDIGKSLRGSREALSARDVSSIREAVEAMTPRDAPEDPSN